MGRKEAVKGQRLQDKVAELYESIGYKTKTNVAVPYEDGHYFIDVVAKKGVRTKYIECKNYEGRIDLGGPSKFKNVVSLTGLEKGLFRRSIFVYRGQLQLGSDDIGLELVSFDDLEKKIKRVKWVRRLRNVFLLAGVGAGAYYHQEVYDFFMGEGFENVVDEIMEWTKFIIK